MVEERLFSACYQQNQTWKQRKEFKEKKVEDCAWTPVVDDTMLKFLESSEIVEELLEHFMDPVNGSNAKGRKPIGMCCLHVDDLFIAVKQASINA